MIFEQAWKLASLKYIEELGSNKHKDCLPFVFEYTVFLI